MTFSLETRNPYLDVRLVEAARGLRSEDLLHDGYTKWALREAVRDVVPAEVVDRARKQGFTTDEAIWLREGFLSDDFERTFSSESFARRGYFDPPKLLAALREHREGGSRAAELWRAYVVERWFRLFIDPEHVDAAVASRLRVPLERGGDGQAGDERRRRRCTPRGADRTRPLESRPGTVPGRVQIALGR